MNDDRFDPNDPGDREIERRLRAYADERLSPSVAAATRMRAAVMTAAHRRAALIEAEATVPTTASRRVAGAATGHRAWRRPLMAFAAAGLTLGILAGSALAARPGGPLYEARLWTEVANLPTDVVARAKAEVERLEARLDEARQASAAGDGPATEAALEAYSSIVVEAAAGSGGDATALAAIEIGVTRHVSVLTSLADRVPLPAQAAIQHALSSSSKVLDDIDLPPGKGTGGGPNDPAATPTDKPGKPTPDDNSGPAATDKPDKTKPPGGPPSAPPGNPDAPEPSRRP